MPNFWIPTLNHQSRTNFSKITSSSFWFNQFTGNNLLIFLTKTVYPHKLRLIYVNRKEKKQSFQSNSNWHLQKQKHIFDVWIQFIASLVIANRKKIYYVCVCLCVWGVGSHIMFMLDTAFISTYNMGVVFFCIRYVCINTIVFVECILRPSGDMFNKTVPRQLHEIKKTKKKKTSTKQNKTT